MSSQAKRAPERRNIQSSVGVMSCTMPPTLRPGKGTTSRAARCERTNRRRDASKVYRAILQRRRCSSTYCKSIGTLKATSASCLQGLTLDVGPEPMLWGRESYCTTKHTDRFDVRISRIGLWVSWCCKDLATSDTLSSIRRNNQNEPWEGRVIIATWAKAGVFVNKTHLAHKSGKGYTQFGYLRPGDKVTMFRDKEERLEFVWSSPYGGASRQQPFQVFEDRRGVLDAHVEHLREIERFNRRIETSV